MNSLEALEELSLMINREKHINSEWNKKINDLEQTIKQDLERLELIEALYNKSLKEMETIKNDDRELYLKFKQLENENEQLKQDHDKTLINNGELVVKVTDLQKENQELKESFKISSNDQIYYRYNELKTEYQKLKKAIEILKKSFISIKILGDLKIYNLTNNVALGVYATEKDLELLKEVLE